MAEPIAPIPISDGAISGDDDLSLRPHGVLVRRRRRHLGRYPALDLKPTYDSLSQSDRAAVDRLVVGFRMLNNGEIA